MVCEGLSVELSRASRVNLGVVTDTQGNSQWSGIDVLLRGADGGYFFMDTTANDNVTLNMDSNANKPSGSSHTLIYAEVSLTGFVNNGTDFIFQKFTKSGEWQAWINHECDDGNDFVLTW
jgi:hypothetical protein